MYFIKNKLDTGPINESAKILFTNFIVNFAKYACFFFVPGYIPDPVHMMDSKLNYMMTEYKKHYKLTKEVENKIGKLIEKMDNKKLTVLNIKEMDKYIHLKYQLSSMNKYNPVRKRIFNKQTKYSLYNFFYRLLLDNDWKLIKQIDAYTIPQLICGNTYIIFLSFDEYEIKKIFTLATDNMFSPDAKVELIEVPFKDKIKQSEFRK